MALAHTLYLAYDGGMITPGTEDATLGRSSIATISATLPPYLQNDPQRATKLAAITSQLMMILAPYAIDVVTTRPAAAPYGMIVFTSAAPTAIGGTGSAGALVPASCNMISSVIGFEFGGGAEIPRDVAVRNAIAMFGVMAGIPFTTKGGDCMCLVGLTCANVPAPCTIGFAGTPVTTGPGSCGFTGTVDEQALFKGRFGTR
jgi:hypothetical protein